MIPFRRAGYRDRAGYPVVKITVADYALALLAGEVFSELVPTGGMKNGQIWHTKNRRDHAWQNYLLLEDNWYGVELIDE